ncbi:4-hydroxybutyrate CoA-transferase, partial [Pseudomonas sp. FW306-02-F08-AA]
YVVTEFGVAYLHGRTIRQRAEALIEIAHPKFREDLYAYCEKTRWLQRPSLSEL